MYPVSENYKNETYHFPRQAQAYVAVGGYSFADVKELASIKLSFSSAGQDIIGQAVSQSAEVEMLLTAEEYAAYFDAKSSVGIFIGLPTGSTIEYVPRPPMQITAHKYDKDTGKLTFSCADSMCSADGHTVGELEAMAYPTTADGYLSAICETAGIPKSAKPYFGSGLILEQPPNFDGSESLRTALKGLAQMCACNCFINGAGELEMKDIVTDSVETLDGTVYSTARTGKKIISVNTVALTRQPQNDIIYAQDKEAAERDGVSPIVIENNPFMDASREDFAPLLLEHLRGLSFFPCEINWRGNPALEPFDRLTVQTNDGGTYATYLFAEELLFNGGLKSTLKNECCNQQTVSYAKGATLRDKLKHAEIEVDKVKNRISSLVEEDDSLRSQITQTADAIRQEVSEAYVTVGEHEALRQSTATRMDIMSGEVSIKFTEAEENLQKVDGELQEVAENLRKHFRFTADGLEIAAGENTMSLALVNNLIVFKKNGQQFGWWDGIDFHTGNVVVDVGGRAQFGSFAFVPRSAGSLMFMKVGD